MKSHQNETNEVRMGIQPTTLNKQDIDDIKTVLNEQFDSIKRLGKMPLSLSASGSSLETWKDYQTIYNDILECNKVMMEIVCGPIGGIEKLVERNNAH